MTAVSAARDKKIGKLHLIKTIIGAILIITVSPVLIFNLTLIICSFLNPNETPCFFGYKPFVVLSGSMEPAIHTGDLIFIKTVEPEALKISDIISFKSADSVITHRISGIVEKDGKTCYITKGDANNELDPTLVDPSAVEGLFQFRIPKLGSFILFLREPAGIALFIAGPLVLAFLPEVLSAVKKLMAKRQKS